MRKYENRKLNIKRLLASGDLDIKGIAEKNESLTANEYFSGVEYFIDNSMQFTDTLLNASQIAKNVNALKEMQAKLGVSDRMVNFEADNEVITKLKDIKDILTKIGYYKLNNDIDSLCDAIKSNSLQLAEKIAAEVYDEFNMLLDRINRTNSIKKFVNVQSADDINAGSNNTVLLKEALDYLDYEEENRKLRILAVDDISIVLNSITSILSPYYEVFALKSSLQVEKFLTHTTPELFLLDIEMNEMNGFDLVPLIRSFEEHKETPIIFLTGNASYDNLRDALALGACDFITKPVNKDILLEKIGKSIVRKSMY